MTSGKDLLCMKMWKKIAIQNFIMAALLAANYTTVEDKKVK